MFHRIRSIHGDSPLTAYDAAVTTIGIGSIGVFVAYIFWYLNDKGIWIDQAITATTTITEIMAIIIVIFILVGVLLAAMRSR